MLLRYRQFMTVLALLAIIATIPGFHPRGAEARERPSPRISLSVFQCPPGMTDATLVTVDCAPLVDGFDVDIISIDGTQPKITVANGQHEGHVVRWTVLPSDAEVDQWGLKQTQLPAGSTQYLVQGESVSFDPAPVYDYRFQTSEEDPQTDLSLYVFSSATQGVIIPPSDATGNESDLSAPQPETEAESDQSTSESPAATETPAEEPDIAVDAPVDTSHAAPQESPTDSETIAQENVAIRLAADLSSVVIDTVSSGEVVSILSGPIEAGQDLWYRVESSTDARGWVQAMAFEAVSAAPAGQGEGQAGAASAAPVTDAAVFAAGDRAIVSDPPLNLRSAPGSTGAVVATLEEGDLLQIDADAGSSDGNHWYAVTLLPEGVEHGYVAGAFLTEVGFLQGEVVEVSSDVANIRAQPLLSADSIGTLSAPASGTIVSGPVSADGYDWYLLLTQDNRSGWVAGSLLTLSGDAAAPAAEGDTVAPVAISGTVFRTGAWVRVSDPPINLRSTADPDSAAIEALDESDPLVVLSGPESAGGYTWYLVDVNGVQGYAAGEFLTGGFLPGEAIEVIDASVYLRTEPGVAADIVWSIDKGETATVLSPDPLRDGENYWILVQAAGGETGYVAIEFIRPVSEGITD